MVPAARETKVQFGLRAVLCWVAVSALIFGAAAPVLRRWSAAERLAFFTGWVAALVACSGFVAAYCGLRWRAERRAGREYCSLPLVNARRWYFYNALNSLAMLGVLLAMSLAYQEQARDFSELGNQGRTLPFSPMWSIPIGISVGMPLAMSVILLWWRALRIELCENGILYIASFVPWSSVTYQLEDNPPLPALRLVSNRFVSRLTATVPGEILNELRGLLEAQAKA